MTEPTLTIPDHEAQSDCGIACDNTGQDRNKRYTKKEDEEGWRKWRWRPEEEEKETKISGTARGSEFSFLFFF